MSVAGGELRVSTQGDCDVVDLTTHVAQAVGEAGVETGQASAFVRGSTAAITTMEFEPGGVHDLQALLDRLIPAAGRLRAQPAEPRHQLPRPPARIADRPLRDGSDRGWPPGPGDLAAACPRRLRRPPARADRDHSGHRLRPSASQTSAAAGAISSLSRRQQLRPARLQVDRLAGPARGPPRARPPEPAPRPDQNRSSWLSGPARPPRGTARRPRRGAPRLRGRRPVWRGRRPREG